MTYTRLLKLTSPLMYGEDVKAVQNKLNSLGFNCGSPDGYFGANTQNAVKAFQSSIGLSADGICGPATWEKLFGSSSGSASSSYEKRTVNGMAMHIISTTIANIETETILKPLANTPYSGINGGFFDATSYSQPPTSGSSICYNNLDVGKYVTVDGIRRIANFHENQQNNTPVYQRTLTIYKSGSTIKARIDKLTHVNQAFNLVGESNVINCIGGYSPELTGSLIASGKAAISINGSNAYLLFAPGVTQNLFNSMLDTGLGKGITRSNTVMMDGSGSAGMKNGSQYIGTERRYIYNCIRIK